MDDLLILNAELVNEGRRWQADVAIANRRIAAIGPDLQGRPARAQIDASGLLLLPGMIDDQVHFREPGLTHKGDIQTESRAAVAGGITSYMEMPNCSPPTLNREALLAKHAAAAKKSAANYSFYLGASNDNLDDIRVADPKLACAIKVFMGASTGNMLVDDAAVLDRIFAEAPLLIATHCEDTPTIEANQAVCVEQYGEAIPIQCHPRIRSAEACLRSSSFAVELAKTHDARLHVLHLTTARELDLFTPGPVQGKRITGEACVHHLFFSDADYAEKGSLIKCNPAIKTDQDRQALLAALREDRLDVIATDHAPHLLEEKDRPYLRAPAGLPLVQDALLSLFHQVAAGNLTLEQVVQKTSHAPATLFGIAERGFVREGHYADLVLVDPNCPTLVTREAVRSKCGWSPFEGTEFSASIHTTIINGAVAYTREGGLQSAPVMALDCNAVR